VSCPEEEERTIISLDMSAMSSILAIGRSRDPFPIYPVPLAAFFFDGKRMMRILGQQNKPLK
jgi:hypothetical protein